MLGMVPFDQWHVVHVFDLLFLGLSFQSSLVEGEEILLIPSDCPYALGRWEFPHLLKIRKDGSHAVNPGRPWIIL